MKHLIFLFPSFIFIAGHIYASARIWQYLPFGSIGKWIGTSCLQLAFLIMIVNFILSFNFDMTGRFKLMTWLYEIGTSYMFVLLYLVLLFLLGDLLSKLGVLPSSFIHSSWVGSVGVTAVMLLLLVGGNIHYKNKYRENFVLKSEKPLVKPLKIVMVSDLHIGYHNPKSELSRWVDIINGENPDLVLIAGDIVDFSIVPVLEQDDASEFRRVNAPIYACYGNHDHMSGITNAKDFFERANIRVLCDETVVLPSLGVALIGRDDRTNKERLPIREIVTDEAKQYYTILMDHQPYHLEEAEENQIDFQFSGHTHEGQVWPLNYIVNAIYECGYGRWTKGKTEYYISSGLGIWGGKFRIGTRSEYVVAELSNLD